MRPRLTIPLSPEDKAACARWSRRVLGIWVLLVIATLALPVFRGEPANVHARGQGTKLQYGQNFLQGL